MAGTSAPSLHWEQLNIQTQHMGGTPAHAGIGSVKTQCNGSYRDAMGSLSFAHRRPQTQSPMEESQVADVQGAGLSQLETWRATANHNQQY